VSAESGLARQWLTKAKPEADRLRESLALLMPYAVEIRYPDDACSPEHEDAREAREAAEDVLRWLQGTSSELFAQDGSPPSNP